MTPPLEIPAALLDALRRARQVVASTGAGVSAESGVPTFRDAQTGFWANFKPEDLATPEAFCRNPKFVWDWYAMRRRMLANVAPNPGHHTLVELARRIPRFTLITQNVDGLHQRAGSRDVIELHGNIARVKCFDCEAPAETWDETGDGPPHCPHCGGLLRPDVVWFGESLPISALEAAMAASADCDVFLTIGTAAAVYPAAALPYHALERGATVVEINPNPTDFTRHATHALRGPSGQVLPALVKAAWSEQT
jgi:NAD-dependent deacetylase